MNEIQKARQRIMKYIEEIGKHVSSDVNESIISWSQWLEKHKFYSSHTVIAYLSDLLLLISFLSSDSNSKIDFNFLQKISVQNIRGWLAYRKKVTDVSSRSNLRSLSSLKNFFSYVKKQFDIDITAVFGSISISRVHKKLPKALSESEAFIAIENVDKISLESWEKLRDKAILFLMYGCGLRISEVLNIKKVDFTNDYKESTFKSCFIRGKGGKERILPLLPIVGDSISKYMDEVPYDIEQSFFFVGSRGKKLNPDVFRHKLRKLRIQYNLPEYTSPHTFRHTFATHLLDNGNDIRIIQEALGHESLSSTELYTKVGMDSLLQIYKDCHPRNKKK